MQIGRTSPLPDFGAPGFAAILSDSLGSGRDSPLRWPLRLGRGALPVRILGYFLGDLFGDLTFDNLCILLRFPISSTIFVRVCKYRAQVDGLQATPFHVAVCVSTP